MDWRDTKKRIVIGAVAILAAGFLFIFRDRVSSLFNFGPDFSKKVSDLPIQKEPKESQKKEEPVVEKPKLPPLYTGRDPVEIRPVPEEVKLFTEAQKEKLYADIRAHARVVADDPDTLFSWIQLGNLKKMIGDFEGARDAWEYASLIRPSNSVSFANLGELYWRYTPNYPMAEKNFLTSIKNKPDDSDTYISLSGLYSYSYAEKEHLADDVLLEGIAANSKDVNLLKSLANLYERQKEYVKAIEWWQKVLEKEPGNASVILTIEALKKGSGR